MIKSKGLEKISVDQLVKEITPHGRGVTRAATPCLLLASALIVLLWVCAATATVPDEVKAELLQRIRTFLQAN